LPYSQVQASQFQVHISYFLQNCKKGKPGEMDLPLLKNDITTFELALKYGIHRYYQILAEDHGRKPVGESVPLKQMKEIV
jgi:hypothetical protein